MKEFIGNVLSIKDLRVNGSFYSKLLSTIWELAIKFC